MWGAIIFGRIHMFTHLSGYTIFGIEALSVGHLQENGSPVCKYQTCIRHPGLSTFQRLATSCQKWVLNCDSTKRFCRAFRPWAQSAVAYACCIPHPAWCRGMRSNMESECCPRVISLLKILTVSAFSKSETGGPLTYHLRGGLDDGT